MHSSSAIADLLCYSGSVATILGPLFPLNANKMPAIAYQRKLLTRLLSSQGYAIPRFGRRRGRSPGVSPNLLSSCTCRGCLYAFNHLVYSAVTFLNHRHILCRREVRLRPRRSLWRSVEVFSRVRSNLKGRRTPEGARLDEQSTL